MCLHMHMCPTFIEVGAPCIPSGREWLTHATLSGSQAQTLTGTSARASHGLHGRGDGHQCGLNWERSSV